MTPPTLPPEIEAAIINVVVVTDLIEGEANARDALRTAITAALAAAREAGRREVLERARTLSTGADISGKNAIEAALLAYRNAVSDWEHSDPISGEGKDAEARQCAAYLDVLAATDEAETAAFIRGRDVVRKYPDGWGLRLLLAQDAAERLIGAFYDEMNAWHPDGHGRPARVALLAALTGKGLP